MYLSKSDILSFNDKETQVVNAWGGEVIVGTMSGSDRDYYELTLYKEVEKTKNVETATALPHIRALLCSLAIVDEAGNKLFSPADIAALGSKSYKELDKVYTVADKLNGITPDEQEVIEKNLEKTQG